jgi:hypothetical protein
MPDDKNKKAANDNKIIFAISDPTGVTVSLYAKQLAHIKDNHPEIKPVAKVRSCVQNPDLILHDEERNARIYTTLLPTNLCFNVFTGIVSETECRIRTSYIKTLPNGDCIWQRPKK